MAGLIFLAVGLGLALLAGGYYLLTQKAVTLDIDGQVIAIYTHQRTVGDLLAEMGVTLLPEDLLTPAPGASLRNNMVIQVRRAAALLVVADGHTLELLVLEAAPLDILAQAGITLGRYDRILVDGRPADPAAPLPVPLPGVIEVIRAVPMTVEVDGQAYNIYTTAPTVGQTLDEMGIALFAADAVTPPLENTPAPGMRVTVTRAAPVIIEVDAVEVPARVQAATVGEALAAAGFALVGEDYSLPPLEAPLPADGRIRIVRVREEVQIAHSEIPYDTIYRPDHDLPLDERRLIQSGAPGVMEQRTRIRYENDVAVSHIEDAPRVVASPTDEIIAYGTRIVIRTLDSADGPLEYWRVIRMLATSYTPATSSKPPDAPNYGIASTGIPVEKGIVAVDPEVIPYFTQVYVPGYGTGLAADTGGAVNGRRIDLGYSDDDLVLWYSWVDVYLLTPPPPAEEILYLLP
ncbi:MAG: DUF348 domain-containing protein [Anaerolineae bacterium]|nr:DUF348 domain-containing protein [Anaerolineae bacterium]